MDAVTAEFPNGSSRKRLTPEEKYRIVELRLQHVPVLTVAEQLGCSTKTVQNTFKAWIKETAAARQEDPEAKREELIQQSTRLLREATYGAARARTAKDSAAEVAFMGRQGQAIRELARLTGADAPTKVEHSGEIVTEVRWVEEVTGSSE